MTKLPRGFQLYVVAVVATAGLFLRHFSSHINWNMWPEVLLFAVLIGLATMFPIPDPHGGYIMATPVLFYVLFAVQSPGVAMLLASVSYATGAALSLGWVPWRMIFNGAQIGVSVGVGSAVFRLLGGTAQALDVSTFVLPLAGGALAHQFTNNFFVATYYSLLRRLPLLPTWFSDFRDLMVSNLLGISSAVLLAALYVSVHPLTLLLYLPSLPVQRWALQLYLQQRRIHGQAIDALVVAIDAHFPQGRGHSRRVANIASAIARKMGLPEDVVESVELGALLHDVGLIGIEEGGGTLALLGGDNAARFREHARIGAEIAAELPRKDVAKIVLYHHERFDGTGYPSGLSGTKIPIGARVVALAEVYDTMISGGLSDSGRLSRSDAVQSIQSESGKAFDPDVVRAFVAAFEEGLLDDTESVEHGDAEVKLTPGSSEA